MFAYHRMESNMSRDVRSLTERYMDQSPLAFTAIAMHADGGERPGDDSLYGGASKCDYPCCNEDGCCSSGIWYAGLAGGALVCCACCCYLTNGFNGLWTYWPF